LERPAVPLVRAAALTHFAEVAQHFGLDTAPLLAEVGLPAHCLEDPDLKVSARAVCQLLEQAAERARAPAFALRMVQQRRLSNIGPLALLVRDQPTLRDVLESIVRYQHLHNEALGISIEPSGDLVLIREDLLLDLGAPPRQAHELVVGVTFKVLGLFLGAGWHPRLVCFAHAAPADMTLHRRLFGAEIAFGCEFSGLVCAAADLTAPNPGADPVLARYALQMISDPLLRPADWSARVRELIVLMLPRGHCRVERVAQHLRGVCPFGLLRAECPVALEPPALWCGCPYPGFCKLKVESSICSEVMFRVAPRPARFKQPPRPCSQAPVPPGNA